MGSQSRQPLCISSVATDFAVQQSCAAAPDLAR